MLINGKLILRIIEEKDLEIIRNWRISKDIRDSFEDKTIISKLQQQKWYEKISLDNSQYFFIAENNNESFGVLNIQNIKFKHRTATVGWYFIKEKNVSSLIIQSVMLLLDYAFDELNIRKIYSDVLETNNSALSFNSKIGFEVEGIRKKHIFHNGKYIDLILVGMFHENYLNSVEKYRKKFFRI